MKKINKMIIIVCGLLLIVSIFVLSLFYSPYEEKHETCTKKYELFLDLFKEVGYKISDHYSANMPDKESLIVLFDYKKEDYPDISNLLGWVKSGGTLFLAGIKEKVDPVNETGIVKKATKEMIVKGHLFTEEIIETKIQINQCFDTGGKDIKVVLSTPNCLAISATDYGEGKVYLLSDSMLMSFINMKKEGVAVFFNNFLKKYFDQKIYIYKNRYSLANDVPGLGVLFLGRIKFLSFQLILVGILFLLAVSIRFGKPVKYQKYVRRSLRTHLIAVGHFYRKAGANRIIEKISHNYFSHRLKEILKITAINVHDPDFIDQVSKRARTSKQNVSRIMDTAGQESAWHILKKERLRSKLIERLK